MASTNVAMTTTRQRSIQTNDGYTYAPRAQEVPVGSGEYVVKPGDCIASIAYEHGHLWNTIFDHPDNRELKQARERHHILLPGDRVTIPPICEKEVVADTDMRHKFILEGATEVFQMRLLNRDQTPRSHVPYTLHVGSKTFSGTTDEQGTLRHSIPSNAKVGHLIIGTGDETEALNLQMGGLDPKITTTGAQARLTNLGFDVGPIDGILGPKTAQAIARFQRSRSLTETGKLDDETIQQLEALHLS